MVDKENGYRHRRQKNIMGKMMAKVLIPFINKNRVECSDESRWPITMKNFEGLDYHLPIKFPRIHQWQAIAQCYNNIKQAQTEG